MAIDPETLKLRYPAFAAVPDATIAYWLTDAAREVDASWGDLQEPATLALAAHSMTVTPGVMPSAAGMQLPGGLTSFKSADASLTFSDAAAARAAKGGFAATEYGLEFLRFQRRHLGGPRLVGPVFLPC
ncbi:DUF4054 domain-containing protein [Sphingomonas sp. ABOLF]|uniref:DUF4054 domain-containing protein n=1 Tax=Sphingomonas sp. ABOLF TaxID=1985879 RepID=UPI000F7E232D|nr:DUF4054 domain-containing protein [Sphingomonas sp. ABOLF]RSV15678.1 DUF4054 domain-containing protein [Sphingomonas sp. ABOLF]